ncbi:NAD-dependent protein deacylase [Aquibacillus sediminis]|uniref:NAD-dependent protein deacylase n=1 Tax=Aquibacillus sediminis TaxID=2574734 RepID=UPI0011084958|nr:NAD-dependent protein deacylase [Aquibacillus sediminis]
MEQLRELTQKIKQANNIVVLTGAGVSTASGIPDFRSTKGIWSQDHSREYYMSREYFFTNPEDFWVKYKDIFQIKLLKDYQPNRVHYFLKELENEGKKLSIVTQNVDGLHREAGSSRVIEYHGNLNTAICPSCGTVYDLDYVMKEAVPYCNQSGCGDVLKPNIVLFGDPITKHTEAEAVIDSSQMLLVLGTSLTVTPFSLLPNYASHLKMPMVIINREPTAADGLFDYVIHADLTETIHKLEDIVF